MNQTIQPSPTNTNRQNQPPKWKWPVVISLFLVPLLTNIIWEGDIPDWIGPLSILAIPAWIIINRIPDLHVAGIRRRTAILIISFITLVAVAFVVGMIARDTDMPNQNIYT